MDFETGLNHYSDNSKSYYVTDGIMHSLADLKKAYKNIGPSVEELHNTIESWHVQVLSSNIVTFSLPVKLKLKLKKVQILHTRACCWEEEKSRLCCFVSLAAL